jgi:hypothetical protein
VILFIGDCPLWKSAVGGRNIALHSDGRSDVYYFYSNLGQHDSYEWYQLVLFHSVTPFVGLPLVVLTNG